jgi:hypothetical protein
MRPLILSSTRDLRAFFLGLLSLATGFNPLRGVGALLRSDSIDGDNDGDNGQQRGRGPDYVLCTFLASFSCLRFAALFLLHPPATSSGLDWQGSPLMITRMVSCSRQWFVLVPVRYLNSLNDPYLMSYLQSRQDFSL